MKKFKSMDEVYYCLFATRVADPERTDPPGLDSFFSNWSLSLKWNEIAKFNLWELAFKPYGRLTKKRLDRMLETV